VVGKTGNTIPMAPSDREIVPATKKSARTIFWLDFVSLAILDSCCISRKNVVMVLKCLLFAWKKAVLFAKFVKLLISLQVEGCFDFYQPSCCRKRHVPDSRHHFDSFSEVAQVLQIVRMDHGYDVVVAGVLEDMVCFG